MRAFSAVRVGLRGDADRPISTSCRIASEREAASFSAAQVHLFNQLRRKATERSSGPVERAN